MKQSEFSMIYNYLYNMQNRFEEELRQAQVNLRYKKVDVVDCAEFMCCVERYNTFLQVSSDIRELLNIFDYNIRRERSGLK